MKHTKSDLRQMQSLPLAAKIRMTERRIMDWYDYWNGNVYVSFSGGKDSTVLLDICRKLYPDIEALFVDTGLEYPEIRQFVKTFENVTIVRPEMRFDEVIKTFGYPLISKEVSLKISETRRTPNGYASQSFDSNSKKVQQYGARYDLSKWKPILESNILVSHKCCDVMKKKPAKDFEKRTGKKPILATMADESAVRTTRWLQEGCNAFESKRPRSQPMSFWTEQDVYKYIKKNDLPIASVYGQVVYSSSPEQMRIEEFIDDCETDKLRTTGCSRTGCIFCGFGCHLEKSPSRFESLKETHPRQYEYCIGGGEYDERGKWQPNKKGLGLGHVFDELNKIYGDDFIKY